MAHGVYQVNIKVHPCYFRATGKNSDTAVGFVDFGFTYGTDISPISGQGPCDLGYDYCKKLSSLRRLLRMTSANSQI